jgi:hypothetical protein
MKKNAEPDITRLFTETKADNVEGKRNAQKNPNDPMIGEPIKD